MVSLITHNYIFLKRKEIWFYNNENVSNAEYTVYIAAKNKPIDSKTRFHTQITACINLLDDINTLLSNIQSGTRYDIKMGEKQNLKFTYYSSINVQNYEKLLEEHDSFAAQKKIAHISKKWFLSAVKNKLLHVTKISDGENDISTHIYLADDREVILTHSFHNIKYTNNTMRGYANKLLHWKDILTFKEKGLTTYNFGGLNPTLKGISDFKARFGAQLTEQYSYISTSMPIHVIVSLLKSNKKDDRSK